MWGGNGTSHDIVEPPKDLISVQIKSKDTIDRLTFTYKDTKGNQQTVSWGGNMGDDHPAFVFHPNEYVKEVSGSVGPFPLQKLPYTVNSLKLLTSEGRTCGPWGKRGDNDTDFKVPVEKGRIVGFHVRGDGFISAIGFYIHP
uniref:Jacalin-type lectin domain-containing protein n=1 Tax=Oryza punctata TaxID=4537 RepID=A0A0E0JI94_ORYPU